MFFGGNETECFFGEMKLNVGFRCDLLKTRFQFFLHSELFQAAVVFHLLVLL
jgi:hypothetical protein